MATIGLDKLYYAKITEDENGNETYASPVQMAKAMTADLSVELAEATLYADDGLRRNRQGVQVRHRFLWVWMISVLLSPLTLRVRPSMPTA